MNDLYRALGDIDAIRKQVARTTEFRGYGPATLATTGLLALLGAAVQVLLIPNPSQQIRAYLAVWILTALLSVLLTAAQMRSRARRIHSTLSDEMIGMAVEQFLPSAVAGLLITVVVVGSAPQCAWMLPGLWQIVFSLGIFASRRFLPRPMLAAALWYLLAGLACLSLGDARALSPVAMAVPFAAGQWLVAAILRFSTPEANRAA